MTNVLARLRDFVPRLLHLDRRLDEMKVNQGLLLAEMHATKASTHLRDYEFKVFSQWGEDGILQYLTSRLEFSNRTFIEFGVEDFFESNCRFLMMKDLWQGFVIDGSDANVERLRSSYFYWRYRLDAQAAFITRENVAELLARSGFDREVGILSVDVDGMDWYLLEALGEWRPVIVVVEYNSVYGAQRAVTVPYDGAFQRNRAHWSNLYWGASLPAFMHLLDARGYGLVGVNSMGSNAFFVRRDRLNDRVVETTVAAAFRESVFREGRDSSGALTFIPASEGARAIAELPLIDVESGERIRVADVLSSSAA